MAVGVKRPCGDRNPCIDFRVWIRLCKTVVPVDFAGVYAFLTIQVEDISILKFIRYACAYFLVEQQSFEWRYRGMVADE